MTLTHKPIGKHFLQHYALLGYQHATRPNQNFAATKLSASNKDGCRQNHQKQITQADFARMSLYREDKPIKIKQATTNTIIGSLAHQMFEYAKSPTCTFFELLYSYNLQQMVRLSHIGSKTHRRGLSAVEFNLHLSSFKEKHKAIIGPPKVQCRPQNRDKANKQIIFGRTLLFMLTISLRIHQITSQGPIINLVTCHKWNQQQTFHLNNQI